MSERSDRRGKRAKGARRQYAPEFRQEAVLLAARIGVAAAAGQLGVPASLLYGWQGKARAARQDAQVEQAQASEIARLKRQLADQAEELAILKKAAAYFARTSK
jgi:transposase